MATINIKTPRINLKKMYRKERESDQSIFERKVSVRTKGNPIFKNKKVSSALLVSKISF